MTLAPSERATPVESSLEALSTTRISSSCGAAACGSEAMHAGRSSALSYVTSTTAIAVGMGSDRGSGTGGDRLLPAAATASAASSAASSGGPYREHPIQPVREASEPSSQR